jgi:hypothetical protein
MKFFTSLNILEKSDLASNSSHIFLLKNKLNALTDDFIEGYNVWEKSKAELIIQMADTLEKLHELGEYTDDLNTISTYIRRVLAERGVSEHQLDHVSRVLPSKYKNPDLVTNKATNVAQHEKELLAPINVYQHQKTLETMSTTEFQEQCLREEEEERHVRNIIKARKENREFVSIKLKRPLPRYKKVSAEVPPEHLQGPSSLYEQIKALSQEYLEIHRYLEDIAKSIYEFKPEKELSDRLAHNIHLFRNGFMKAHKSLFVPYSDKKWSGDWLKWMDIHLTRLWHGKNCAGTKHALETGEFALKLGKDGKEFTFALDRGITREQVGDKEEDLFNMAKDAILSHGVCQELHDWSYSTFIEEGKDDSAQ